MQRFWRTYVASDDYWKGDIGCAVFAAVVSATVLWLMIYGINKVAGVW